MVSGEHIVIQKISGDSYREQKEFLRSPKQLEENLL